MFKFKLYEFISKIFIKTSKFWLSICQNFNNYRNNSIKHFLMPYYMKALYRIKHNNVKYSSQFNKIIWTFWWQDTQPLIVRKCLESLYNHSGNFKLIIITKHNVNKYTDIPKYIFDKLNNGNITLTHFSDILRYNLLKNYGGVWIDSTHYCTSNLNSHDFNHIDPFTTIGANNLYRYWVSGKWTGSLIGGHKGNHLFIFMDEFFKIYWKYNNHLINYNLVDYALWFAYVRNIGGFKTSLNSIYSYNNINKFKLVNYLNYNYNANLFKKITSNTQLFKLTYKHKFINKKYTFYYMLVNNKL